MLSGYFFRETRALIMVVLVIAIGGVSSLFSIGRQEDPEFTNLFATVTTLMPGMAPVQIEELISAPLEGEVKGIADITFFSSSSFRGASVMLVAVRDTLPDDEIEQVWIKLREAVERAARRFPEGVAPPQINTSGVAAFSAVVAVEIDDPRLSPAIAARFANTVDTYLRDIPGTRYVQVFGLPEEEILVSVDPYVAATYGVSVDQIGEAIRAADGQRLAGRYINGNLEASLSVSGAREQIDNIRAIPLRIGSLDGVVRVGDMAEVNRQVTTPPSSIARSNGKQAILIAAVVADGAQVDRWMSFVREDVAKLSELLPQGLSLNILFDQSSYTIERLTEVGLNMVFGMALVTAVLVVTLGWRAAIIVAVILPMVSLATMISFRFLGLSLHQMSVAGLIVSLGLVVDAAIVTTDTVRRRLISGQSRSEAATGAARRLFVPLCASTVTTILTFLPMILLPGNAGDFVSTIAIAVSVMLFWSFLLALVMTAPIAAHLLKSYGQAARGGDAEYQGLGFRMQRHLIRHPVRSLAVSCILPLLGFLMSTQLTPQFFPLVERNQFHLSLSMPSHSSVLTTDAVVRRANSYLDDLDGITGQYWVAGGSAPSFYYNVPSGRANEPSYAQGMITTASPRDTRRILETLQQDMSLAFPEARVIVSALAQGPPVGAPVEILIYGPELDELRRIGAEIQGAIAALPSAAQVNGGLTGGLPQLHFDINSDAANLMSLDETLIARQLEAGISGMLAGAFIEGTQQIPIRVQFTQEVRTNADAISDLPILTTTQGRMTASDLPTIPLSTIATSRLETVDSLIIRSEGERLNFVQAFPQPGVLSAILLQEVLDAIEAAQIDIPEGYRIDLGGDSDERASTVDGLTSSLLLIMTLSIATLVLTFQSFRLTVGAGIVAGLSAGLALLSVAIMGFPFGINALIGVIGSIGVSLNAAIIVFTALQANPKAAAGDVDAAAAEVVNGSRHIISTTLTTFGGFLPLMLTDGLFWPPFAAAIAGGVLLSGSLAFLFAPAYFILVMPRSKLTTAHSNVPVSSNQAPGVSQYLQSQAGPFSMRAKHPLRRAAPTKIAGSSS